MTMTETAQAMRRLADAIDRVIAKRGSDCDNGQPKPMLEGDAAIGAAAFLCYLRDLVTCSEAEMGRAEFLVLLEACSRDNELFPCGVAFSIYQAEEE